MRAQEIVWKARRWLIEKIFGSYIKDLALQLELQNMRRLDAGLRGIRQSVSEMFEERFEHSLKGRLGDLEAQKEMPPWDLVRKVIHDLAMAEEMRLPPEKRLGLPRWLYARHELPNPKISLFGAGAHDREAAAERNPHLREKIAKEKRDGTEALEEGSCRLEGEASGE